MVHHRILLFCIVFCGALGWGIFTVNAAESLETSPWIGWKKGYEAYDRGGRMKDANRYSEALSAYREAARYFDAVRRIFPDWNRNVIDGRVRLCEEEIANLTRLAGGSAATLEPVPQPTIPAETGRAPRSIQPVYAPSAPAASIPSSAASGSRLYVEMQAELDQYKQRWRAALAELDELKIKLQQAEASRTDVEGLLRDYRKLQERYSLLQIQYENAKAEGGSAERKALQEQVLALTRKLDEREQLLTVGDEKLRRQQEEYAASRQEVLALKQQAEESANQAKRMERELSLVGSRTGALAAKDAELLKLRTAIEGLNAELNAAKIRIAELTALQEKLKTSGESTSENVLIAENNRLQNELELLRAAQRTGDAARLQKKVDELSAMQTTLADSLQRSTDQQQRLEQENKVLNQKLSALHDEKNQSSTEHQMQQTRIAQLEKELQEWQTRYADLAKRLQERLNADALSSGSLTEANRQLEAKLATQEKRYAELSSVHEELKKVQAKATEENAVTRQQMLDLRSKAAAQEITAGKLAALQKAYDELAAQAQQPAPSKVDETRVLALEESIKRYEIENRALNQKLERAAADLEHLRKAPQPAAQTQQALDQLSTVLAPEKIENLLADAVKAEAAGNTEIAIWGYRQILARQPRHWEAAFRLGKLLASRSEFAAAEPLLQAALQAQPDSADAADALMRALILQKKYDPALQVFKTFSTRTKPTVSLQLSEAVAWSRSGNTAEAERAFKAVLNADAANIEAATELALLLSSQPQRQSEALQFYRQARSHGAEPDPYLEEALKSAAGGDLGSSEFLFNAALESLQQQDLATASWYLQQLQELQKDGDFTLRLAALIPLFQKDFQSAGKAAQALPDKFDRALFAAAAALGRGAIPTATQELQAAKTAKPANFRLMEPQLSAWKTILKDLDGRCKTDAAKAAFQQLNGILMP